MLILSVLSWQFLIKYSPAQYIMPGECWQWPRTLGPPDRKQKGTILLVQQIYFRSAHLPLISAQKPQLDKIV